MARKRDYKAEYQAAKARARRSGFESERQYKRARKEISGAKAMPIAQSETGIKRRQAQEWSRVHSKHVNSKYNPLMDADRVDAYYRAYIDPINEKGALGKRVKRKRIHDYLVPNVMDEKEWESKYPK